MLNDDLRSSIDWGKYQTITPARRDDGVLLLTVAEPKGAPAATLTRRHTARFCPCPHGPIESRYGCIT